ncbi:ATP-binding cassette domain-containing protein, partial [Klebsiella pneumoniae]|uniref:ATP-binding cassette domain-containing protein n=1 Tax=Klebsiella pneumoniae TaxID=573 RepID=UPI00396BEDDB
MSIPLQMASDSFIQVDRIFRYRSHPGLPWQKTLPVNAILKDFSLTLRQHERVGLLGCSGWGKSALLTAILALGPVGVGGVYWDEMVG